MKTKVLNILFAFFSIGGIFAQDVTTVRANSTDISDNLDLQAVASIFGESADLEDFERRLNNPDLRISNLDLNGDNRVDYLRVVESTENNTHLIILQAVLGIDVFQDVATIEVERDRHNNVTVQVVGDVYMYGPNYIYEPIYAVRPAIFNVFWVSSYRPYYSPWYWGYYPTYYTYWNPYPVYRYRSHIHSYVINTRNSYHYVTNRRSSRAVAMHNSRRQNAYERQHPGTSFTSRNTNSSNRHDLVQGRTNEVAARGTSSRDATQRASTVSTGRNNPSVNTLRDSNASRTAVTSGGNNSGRNNAQQATVRSSGSDSNRNTRGIQPVRQSAATTSTRASASSPARSSSASPARNNSKPSRSTTVPIRSSSPATQSTPSRSNSPAVRSSAPTRSTSTPSRSSAPNSSGRSTGRGSSRG
ncbi:hypothetical protein [Flavobacterium rhizosphaerae]|uniref:DUF3300 domain-containing protein n=1 Tax=Flavobacterium rhizosphaerae TaxID=3163298 RepID=A0ABW8YUM0_9FLAO